MPQFFFEELYTYYKKCLGLGRQLSGVLLCKHEDLNEILRTHCKARAYHPNPPIGSQAETADFQEACMLESLTYTHSEEREGGRLCCKQGVKHVQQRLTFDLHMCI